MGDGSGEDMVPSEETRGATIRKKRRGKKEDVVNDVC